MSAITDAPQPAALYTTREVADYCHVPHETVRTWVKRRHVHAIRIGRALRIRGSEVARLSPGGEPPPPA